MATHIPVLEARVLDERQTASFKWLSRRLAVTANAAKLMLSDFVRSKPAADLCVLFHVQGERADGSMACLLVAQDRLEAGGQERGGLPPTPAIELPDCTLTLPKNFDAVLRLDMSINSQDTFEVLNASRAIRCPDITVVPKIRSTKPPSKPAAPSASSQLASAKSHSADSATIKSSLFAKTAPKPSGKRDAPAKVTGRSTFFDKFKADMPSDGPISSDQRDPSEPVSEMDSGEKPSAVVSSPIRPHSPMLPDPGKKARTSTVAKPAAAPVFAPSKKSLEQSQAISMLFDDDDTLAGPSKAKERTQKQPRKLKRDLSGMHEGNDDLAFGAAHGSEAKRVRKRRKVKRTKTVMEGKYMKTIDVSDWESYSEEEIPRPALRQTLHKSAHPTPHAADAQPSTTETDAADDADGDAKGKGGKGKKKLDNNQRTLFNFFGKK
ncbi:TFIIH/NER complex ATP-dependent 5'-3' DNA helicase subunit [Polyrhizophydium stewartii]|uniref:DNA polymerase delta subunit 3 n=1 Tax=Polyrhizophydium stewartii TaxID=2732419 RepID=A0ABR4NFV1_9FUNG